MGNNEDGAATVMLPEKIYSVQIGAYSSRIKAQQVSETAKNLGYSPVFTIQVKGKFRVKVGLFDNFLDARFFRENLRKDKFGDAYITWMSRDGAISRLQFVGNIEQLLDLCSLEPKSTYNQN